MLTETGSELVWELQLANEQEPNSVVQYSVFLGPSTDAPTRARARLIAQITAIPTFDYLRTRQQLGYTAKSDFQFDGPETRYTVRIQTPQDPNFVENRIEEYLDVTVLDILEGLSDETFLQNVTAAKDQLLETPKTLKDETNLYWDHITNADYDFNRHEVDAKCLDTITKDDLVAFYKQAVHTSSTTRRKLSIHLRRKSLPRDDAVRLRPATKMVDDYAAFKLGLQSSRVAPVRLESLVDGTHRANGENGAEK
jgi:insulysin